MDASLKRRISVSTFWATSRIEVLDTLEKYEESFAVTEEFREWITCPGESPELLDDTALMVPNFTINSEYRRLEDQDEMLEI